MRRIIFAQTVSSSVIEVLEMSEAHVGAALSDIRWMMYNDDKYLHILDMKEKFFFA